MRNEYKYGWFYPDKTIKTWSTHFVHIEEILNDEKTKEFVDPKQILEFAEERYRDAYQDFCEMQSSSDDYYGWHLFNDSTNENIYKSLYEAGFYRLGIYKDKFGEWVVEIEGDKQASEEDAFIVMDWFNAHRAHCYYYPGYGGKISKNYKRKII